LDETNIQICFEICAQGTVVFASTLYLNELLIDDAFFEVGNRHSIQLENTLQASPAFAAASWYVTAEDVSCNVRLIDPDTARVVTVPTEVIDVIDPFPGTDFSGSLYQGLVESTFGMEGWELPSLCLQQSIDFKKDEGLFQVRACNLSICCSDSETELTSEMTRSAVRAVFWK
jgi:hypothetical protein